MLPALASVSELEARLGLDPDTLVGPDLGRARAALDDASALVRLEAGRTWVDTTTGALTTVPDAIVRVVLGAAQRNFSNPDAAIQETVGPFARRLNETDTGVYLTRPELDIVHRFRTNGELWTLQTTRDGDDQDTIWYQDSFGTEPFPLASTDDVVWPA